MKNNPTHDSHTTEQYGRQKALADDRKLVEAFKRAVQMYEKNEPAILKISEDCNLRLD